MDRFILFYLQREGMNQSTMSVDGFGTGCARQPLFLKTQRKKFCCGDRVYLECSFGEGGPARSGVRGAAIAFFFSSRWAVIVSTNPLTKRSRLSAVKGGFSWLRIWPLFTMTGPEACVASIATYGDPRSPAVLIIATES